MVCCRLSTLLRPASATVWTWSRTAPLTASICWRVAPVSVLATSASWRAYWWLSSTICWMKANWRSTASVASTCGRLPTLGKARNWLVTESRPLFQLSMAEVRTESARRALAAKSSGLVVMGAPVVSELYVKQIPCTRFWVPRRRHLRHFHRVEPSASGGSGRRSRQGGGPGGWVYPPRSGPAAQIAPAKSVDGQTTGWRLQRLSTGVPQRAGQGHRLALGGRTAGTAAARAGAPAPGPGQPSASRNGASGGGFAPTPRRVVARAVDG